MVKATEQHEFQMHPNLLKDVITRQAGTISKAVLEGVMNSIEAGATKVEIELRAAYLTISDDGRGFTDKTQVRDPYKSQAYRQRIGRTKTG